MEDDEFHLWPPLMQEAVGWVVGDLGLAECPEGSGKAGGGEPHSCTMGLASYRLPLPRQPGPFGFWS